MHGEPALPADFTSFPYVNPDAPKGGRVVYAVQGTFDSVNPFIVKGVGASGVNTLVFETVMRRSADEPFTFYPLIAQSIETDANRSFVTFRVNPAARFSDGKPVTAHDIAFSFDLLKTKGRPNTRQSYSKVDKVDVLDDLTIRFDLTTSNDRELPLIIATMPVLPRHAVDPATFEESTLKPMIGSGPYRLTEVEPGKSVTYTKNAEWWGADLPSNRGLFNFDTIRFDYYRDANSMFEAFKTGGYDVRIEVDATRWATQYDFPALTDGRVIKESVSNGLPKGMNAFAFNTRRPVFANAAAREAIALMFDFEWVNKNLFFGLYARTHSFFQGSDLASTGRPADEVERALLAPFPDAVAPAILEGQWKPPVSDGSGRDRTLARKAVALLRGAGYTLTDGAMRAPDGTPLAFEILVKNKEQERLALNFSEGLKLIGIQALVRLVDDVQYQKRLQTFDFDMIQTFWPASLSPGNEQNFRWSTSAAGAEGSFNFAGVQNPAVDAMIKAMLAATSREAFVSAVRALDRVLLSGHYVVPLYNTPEVWMVRWATIGRPERPALTGAVTETFWRVAP